MSRKVLVVEDEPILAMEICEALAQRGFEVPEPVISADTVMKAFGQHRPDVVIMDINLRSYTDGVDAAKRLSLFGQVPVVFLTANQDPSVETRARGTTNSYYLKKPYDEDRLVDLIEQILSAG